MLLLNNFNQRLNKIREAADELPAALIIHDIEDLHIVYMNKPGLAGLGTTLASLQCLTQEQYHLKYFNVEDSNDYVPKLIHIIKSNQNEQVSYFQQIKTPRFSEWQLYVSNTKVFSRDEQGKATHLITIASMLDPVHHITSKVNRVMDEVTFLRSNALLFSCLTKREKEVLRSMALGHNAKEMAEKFFISQATADTHRRNIRKKLSLKNNYDAVRFAQAFNLI